MDPATLVRELIARGVPQHAAMGLVGNYTVESGLNPGINEISPTVPGSRGGFGYAQWTGPRRRQYEAYAAERGASLDDWRTQLDFTVHELNTSEARARDAIYAAQSPADAARLVSERFLRPGVPHLDRRIGETMKLAGMDYNALSQPQPQQANALSQQPQQPQFQYNALQLDPRDFFARTA